MSTSLAQLAGFLALSLMLMLRSSLMINLHSSLSEPLLSRPLLPKRSTASDGKLHYDTYLQQQEKYKHKEQTTYAVPNLKGQEKNLQCCNIVSLPAESHSAALGSHSAALGSHSAALEPHSLCYT